MSDAKLRQAIAFEAARLMYWRDESEYFRAKLKAAKRLCRGSVKPKDLPSNAEIRDCVQQFARMHEGQERVQDLRKMRVEALRIMRYLRTFRPRLIGSVLTGHVRSGSDIDIHLFSDSLEAICAQLDEASLSYDVEHKQVRKAGEEQTFRHIHVRGKYPIELTVYNEDLAHYRFKSSITGKAIERASIAELEQFLEKEYPDLSLDGDIEDLEEQPDRFSVYHALLLPLEKVKQDLRWHPEGDALYHSLQVFDRARDELPYDEEFLLAALLHDVGKGLDGEDHVTAGLEALCEFITPRTGWLIAHHMEAQMLADGTLGARARKRLQQHEDYEELMLLCKCDRAGRERGVPVPEIEEALDYIRDLAEMCGE
jgi:predicted HD phosphohydrolase